MTLKQDAKMLTLIGGRQGPEPMNVWNAVLESGKGWKLKEGTDTPLAPSERLWLCPHFDYSPVTYRLLGSRNSRPIL